DLPAGATRRPAYRRGRLRHLRGPLRPAAAGGGSPAVPPPRPPARLPPGSRVGEAPPPARAARQAPTRPPRPARSEHPLLAEEPLRPRPPLEPDGAQAPFPVDPRLLDRLGRLHPVRPPDRLDQPGRAGVHLRPGGPLG